MLQYFNNDATRCWDIMLYSERGTKYSTPSHRRRQFSPTAIAAKMHLWCIAPISRPQYPSRSIPPHQIWYVLPTKSLTKKDATDEWLVINQERVHIHTETDRRKLTRLGLKKTHCTTLQDEDDDDVDGWLKLSSEWEHTNASSQPASDKLQSRCFKSI